MDMKMLIGGEFVDASDGATLKNFNPYNGELIGTASNFIWAGQSIKMACFG